MKYFVLIILGLHVTLGQESETKYGLACEHGPVTLDCPSGQVIRIISASYGRTNGHTCPHSAVSDQNCAAGSTQFIVSNSCNDKPKCTVYASYEIFGDPCYGTYKYMEVRYKCVQSNIKTAVSCEWNPVNLACPSGEVLHIVKANYGRTDTVTCSNPNMHTKNCYAAGSTQIAGNICNNRESCTVYASPNIFGDPCFGTGKFLDIQYECISKYNPVSCGSLTSCGNVECIKQYCRNHICNSIDIDVRMDPMTPAWS